MKSTSVGALAAVLSSLFATGALACSGAECAYAPASPHYSFGPAPAYAPQGYAPHAYAPPAPPAYGPPPSAYLPRDPQPYPGYPCVSCAPPPQA